LVRVLFLPSHVGLGHVARDYVIAKLLRKSVPKLEIDWCSAEPVLSFLDLLEEERIVNPCRKLESFSTVIEDLYNGKIKGLKELASKLNILKRNYEIVSDLLNDDKYDVVFADEFWEIMYSAPPEMKSRIIFGTDILYKPYSIKPVDFFISLVLNRYFKKVLPEFKDLLFLNDLGTLRKYRWYPLFGEKVEEWAKRKMKVTGFVTSFLEEELPSYEQARDKLNVDYDSFLVVVTVGGTSTRNNVILDCIDGASDILIKELKKVTGKKDIIIKIVTGPRTKWLPRNSVKNVEVIRETVPRLLDYYVAADLFISRAGRTTTADLLCLGKPAIYIPIKDHYEQEEIAKDMEERFGYPRIREDECSPNELVKTIKRSLRRNYKIEEKRICNGAKRAAEILENYISSA